MSIEMTQCTVITDMKVAESVLPVTTLNNVQTHKQIGLRYGENNMLYLLIENENLVGICDYEPNIGDDDIKIIPYSGNIPMDRILYLNGKIADSENYVCINEKYVKKTKAVTNLLNTNTEVKNYLNDTDWLVIRHRDQLDLKQETSLTNEQYLDLLAKRQYARERVVEYESTI